MKCHKLCDVMGKRVLSRVMARVMSQAPSFLSSMALVLSPTTMSDDNPRPPKRIRLESSPLVASSSMSSLTSISSSPGRPSTSQPRTMLKPLPAPVLLVTLPYLLAHPPTHKYYVPSLCLSLCALRRCLAFPSLSPEIECRAWTGLAEVGMRVMAGGLHYNEDFPWARGVETEVRRVLLCRWLPLISESCTRSTKQSAKQ